MRNTFLCLRKRSKIALFCSFLPHDIIHSPMEATLNTKDVLRKQKLRRVKWFAVKSEILIPYKAPGLYLSLIPAFCWTVISGVCEPSLH